MQCHSRFRTICNHCPGSRNCHQNVARLNIYHNLRWTIRWTFLIQSVRPVRNSPSDDFPSIKYNWRQNAPWFDIRYTLRGTIWRPFLTVWIKCETDDLLQDVAWNNLHHTIWWPIWWPFLTNGSPSATWLLCQQKVMNPSKWLWRKRRKVPKYYSSEMQERTYWRWCCNRSSGEVSFHSMVMIGMSDAKLKWSFLIV